ncbi:hydrogenase large subunit [Campylobacter fetus subsp. venerealis]|uniref:NADH-quinone oxidoreductase subunit D-related protein n=1 Tax=Campylobacter fetus TaxID=196 RepID=UPI0018E8C26D|nr:hydrogenase large subunit [Campylobacter fetus]QQF52663.1 hydrogenase large subunit [Campylobacter fetus subsp. venerealis]
MIGDKFIDILKNEFNILETSRQCEDQITILVDRNDLPKVVHKLYYGIGGWLSSMVANDERTINQSYALYYVLSMEGSKMSKEDGTIDEIQSSEKCFITVKTLIPKNDPCYPSVTPLVPACVWYEREAYDMFGLVAEGLPDKRRLVLSDDWPENLYPLRKDAMDYKFRPDPVQPKDEPDYEFMRPNGSVTDIPLGPLHITADEPGHFRLYCDGDTIVDADYRLFYQHRGMEKLAENRLNYNQMSYLAERVCGICGFAHSIACVEAVERGIGFEIPRRAQAIRIMSSEIERMHSNLLNLGLACEVTGNYTAFMHIFRVREYTLELAQLITGGRKTYGTIVIGGVRRDITLNEIKQSYEILEKIGTQLDEIWQVVMEDKRQIGRWKGIGILDKQVARDFSPVGPNVRGSGFKRDTRYDHTYGFYKELELTPNVQFGGDVLSRELVRYNDCKQALRLVKQCLDIMPGGAIFTDTNYRLQPGTYCLGYDEAPRGENIHWIMQGDSQKVYRWRCRASTYNNWSSLRYQLQGNTIADAALIVCSLDPCYSCTERVTLVNVKSGKSKVIGEKELKKYCQSLKDSPTKDIR